MKINKKITLLSAAVLALPIAYTISCGTPVEYNDDNKIPPLDINNRPDTFDVVMSGDYAPYNFTLSPEQYEKIEAQAATAPNVDLPNDGDLDQREADNFLKMTNTAVIDGRAGEVYIGGYDVAIAKAITNGTSKPLKIHISPFEKLLPTVAAGNADAAIDGITITQERIDREGVNFSIPYFTPKNGLLFNKTKFPDGNGIGYSHLNGKIIGVENGSIQESILNDLKRTTFTSLEIRPFDTINGALAVWDQLDGLFCEDFIAEFELFYDRLFITPDNINDLNYEMVDFNTNTPFNATSNTMGVAVGKEYDTTQINDKISNYISSQDSDLAKNYSEVYAAWVRNTKLNGFN